MSFRQEGRRSYSADVASAIESSLESLTGLAAFVRAADAKSFVVAGRQLGISASAVGKSIARLEQRLGIRLLHRTTRSVGLTEEGALFYQRAARILAEVAEAEAAVAGARAAPRGRVKLGVPDAIGQFVIAPALPMFCARFPEVEIELHLDDRVARVVEEGFDLVVRVVTEPEDSSLVARRLGPHRFSVCAAPAYLAHRSVPVAPQELHLHEGIHFILARTGQRHPWWFVDAAGHEFEITPNGRLAFNSNAAMLAAAVAGQGLISVPSYVTAEAVRSGLLVPVLEKHVCHRGTVTVLRPRTRQLAPKVRAVLSFLSDLWPRA